MEQSGRMHDLGVVLERLWKFYEAMRSGRPLQDSDEMLAQIGVALRNSAGTSQSGQDVRSSVLGEGQVAQASH